MNTVQIEADQGHSGTDPQVLAYVGLVRLALRDLPAEDLEDLTGGLEADLAELAAESSEPLITRLGEPAAYAAELRAAAGLPPVTVEQPRSRSLSERAGAVGQWWRDRVAERPWLAELRPLWWAARGLVAWGLFSVVLGMSSWFLALLLVAGSVWVGLRTPHWSPSVRRLVRVGNAVAAVLLVPFLLVLGVGSAGAYVDDGGYVEYLPPDGVVVDGEQVGSLYVYDGQGQRVEGARIFTDRGTPLTVDPWAHWDGVGPAPSQDALDVFPVEDGPFEGWRGNTSEPGGWTPPVLIGPAPGLETTGEPVPEPTPSAGADAPAAEPPGQPSAEPTEETATP